MPRPASPRRDTRATSPTGSRPASRGARAAAGGRDILLHGAATARECLRAGLLDEMELQLIPVLLGQGRRLFEDMPPDHIELEPLRALDGPDALHLRYRVRSEA
ncbi:dihydrofolate reductase family protein [Nonomuraea sp. NPDC049709]|uniref:dihydrofolate reductase family protein n=1 Tax=Nonomuraea sp. NPDC049709 TaxID=3154736 RepID=UPI00343DDF38